MTVASTGLRVTKRETLNRCNGYYAQVSYLILYINLPSEWSDSEKQRIYLYLTRQTSALDICTPDCKYEGESVNRSQMEVK
jgi:hypothetical protein